MSEKNSKGTLLIVDDEKDIVFFISKMFQTQGYGVKTVDSGVEALSVLSELQANISLILMDLKMPGMGVLDVLKQIRSKFSDIPVVVATELEVHKQEAEALGVSRFLKKPCELEEIYNQMAFHAIDFTEEKESEGIPADTLLSAKIMIVDDEVDICEYLAEEFTENIADVDYRVRYAHTADDALKLSNEFEPDIAIVDMRMQYMWGDELIKKFKANEAFCPKDFIVYTSSDDVVDKREVLQESNISVVSKTSGITTLQEVVKKICIKHNLFKKQ